MLIRITNTAEPATDLGFLLHKNPANLHSADLAFGKAYVFYSSATAENSSSRTRVCARRCTGAVREFCLYGETTGETDEFGLPVRYNWASEYRGKAMLVYGHTPVPDVELLNNTLNIDTGAVFGGKLTVLRYPEREFASVAADREYSAPIRPLTQPVPEARTSQQELDDVLDLEEVTGKRIVQTRLHRTITIREENSIAALEVMSRFATDPHWLIYLPPSMSPSETSSRPDYLEYPTEAFGFRCELRSGHPDRVEVHADQLAQSVQRAPVPGRSDRFVRALVSPVSALLRTRQRTGGRTWCRGGCQLHLALGAGLCT